MGLENLEIAPGHFQFLANRANAAKSTGPKSARGKEISSANAIKHGFRSTHPSIDENVEEIQAARERFMADLKPRGDIAQGLCELAFRQKRQLERVLAAEDAAVHFRLQQLESLIREDRERFLKDALAKFDADPVDGQAMLRICHDGIDVLLERLADFEREALAGRWEPASSARLLAIEESELDCDEVLDRAAELCDEIRNADRALEEAVDGDPTLDHLKRNTARAQSEHARSEYEPIRRLIVDRLKRMRRLLGEEQIEARTDEGLNSRRLADYAKFDVSHGAQLRRRYISQAQRDYMKALAAAMQAIGWKMSQSGSGGFPQVSTPAAPMPRSSGESRRLLPSEPDSGRDDRLGRDDWRTPPTNVDMRERA